MTAYRLVPSEPTPEIIEAAARAAWELGGATYSGAAILGPWEAQSDLQQKRGRRTFKFGFPVAIAAAPPAPDVVGALEKIHEVACDAALYPSVRDEVREWSRAVLAQLKGEVK
jgi:hypothetical protein